MNPEREPATAGQELSRRAVILSLLVYELVNLLFVLKYAPRAGINPALLAVVHVLLLAAGLFLFPRVGVTLRRLAFIALALSIPVVSLLLMARIDPESLNVDRWSALARFLSSLFEGDYPYAVRTHLDPGNPPSPFPVMQMTALPFFLLGDVGYLNVAIFVGLVAFACKQDCSGSSKLMVLFLYVAAPALWWEIAVRSDLAGNFFLVCFFLLIYDRYSDRSAITRPVLTGILVGLLLSTRAVVLLPLGIYFLNPFLGSTRKQQLLYLVSVAVAFCATFAPFFIFWDAALFLEHNPFVHQSNKASTVAKVIGIGLCLYLAWRTRTLGQALIHSALVLFVLMSGAMLDKVSQVGWNAALYESRFDISYFTTALPFLICSILYYCRSKRTAWLVD